MKIVTIVGARPQFIKAAVVSRAIADKNVRNKEPQITEVIVHTGQHYDANMSDVFFQEMHIPNPNYHLEIGGGSHGAMTGRMLEKIEEVLLAEKPDVVMVYGDTNSTLAGALAAVKLHIPVAHVEAGLRSYNRCMPEEINRIVTDRVAEWLFCPCDEAVRNLLNEGHAQHRGNRNVVIENVGDVMYDAVLFYKKNVSPSPYIEKIVEETGGAFYLATVHRAENTDDLQRLQEILGALEQVACHTPVILPMHPRTQKIINATGLQVDNIRQVRPVGYFDMLFLLRSCQGVFTDSGGLQKEAYFFKKPCITMRLETEWTELVQGRFNVLTDANCERILAAEQNMFKEERNWTQKLYGHGDAGKKIVDILWRMNRS
jgi:UDP-GlcNAc3NAcA epimerase